MVKNFQAFFIALAIICSLKFFDATFIPPFFSNAVFLSSIWIIVILSAAHIFSEKSSFSLPLQLIVLSILFSMVMAYYSWEQSFFHSILETTQYLSWPLFFILVNWKFSIDKLEKIIVFFGLIYVLLFFYQYINQGSVLFGKPLWGDEWTEDRGTIRIIFPGAGIFVLTLFIALTKLTTEPRMRWFWSIIVALGLIIPVMQVTRQFIVGVLSLYLYHLLKSVSTPYKFVVVIVFITGISWVIQSELPNIKGLIEAGQNDAGLGKDYIRVLAGEYFLNEYSPNIASQIFGNGAPYWGISKVGLFNEKLADEKGYYLSDVGIIAVYAMFGIFATLGFILIWIKSFTIHLPNRYLYAKYYLWYILFTSLTWYSVYHYHYIISTTLALYCFQKGIGEARKKEVIKKVLKKLLQDENRKKKIIE